LLGYSTEERWTGKYWTDGKKIYSKTFSVTASGDYTLNNVDTVINFEATALNNNSYWRPCDGFLTTLGSNQINGTTIDVNYAANKFHIGYLGEGMGYTFTKANVTVYYTKTTD